jgi:hypothetical protein
MVKGNIDFPHQTFELTGVATIGVAGFNLSNTTFDATNVGGLKVKLTSNTSLGPYGSATFNGTITKTSNSYAISATGNGTLKLAGYQLLAGTLSLDNTHLTVTSQLSISVLGIDMAIKGTIKAPDATHPFGTFSFTTDNAVSLGPFEGQLRLGLTQDGLKADVTSTVDATTTVFGYNVGFRGNLKSDFNVKTNGTFGANGSVTMTSVFGGDFSETIGFNLSNTQLRIVTSDLQVYIFGYDIHPFGDIVIPLPF